MRRNRSHSSSLKEDGSQLNSILYAVEMLNRREVIAYPTETVFGIGCDPDSEFAVNFLLKLKNRPIEKGLILVASDFKQLKPYIDDSSLTLTQWKFVFSFWPGPTTFVFPAKTSTPYWLTGCSHSLAVRISNHPLVVRLCRLFCKPLVSTSANLAGFPSSNTKKEIQEQFNDSFYIVDGKVGNSLNPSEIYNVLTGERFR